MRIEIAHDARNIVGESVVWDEAQNRVLWVDIGGKKVQSLDCETNEYRSWSAPKIVSSIGLCLTGGAIVGLERSLNYWSPETGFDFICDVENDLPGNRLNEGVVGPDGAFWVGTMQNNIAADGSPLEITQFSGQIYRLSPNGVLEKVCTDRFGITNTFVWTPGGRLITADTLANEIYSYAIEPETHRMTDRKTILKDYHRGLPDGSCRDEEGYIWNCRVVGGACLIRMDPQGTIERVIELPCSWPTSCTFGGPELKTLFVTSARFSMSPAHLEAHPHEGALFRIETDIQGQPANRFSS